VRGVRGARGERGNAPSILGPMLFLLRAVDRNYTPGTGWTVSDGTLRCFAWLTSWLVGWLVGSWVGCAR
jgi:hypothetical protein